MSSAPRRPRRAVRPSGTVGTDESVLRSVLPAPAAAPARTSAPTPATRRTATSSAASAGTPSGAPTSGAGSTGTSASSSGASDDLWRRTRSGDDSDHGWGREEPSSNDDRLRREKPPHW